MHGPVSGCILAIDLGTSGPKVGLADPHGRLLDSEFEPVELLTLPGGGAEQRPASWWNAIVQATRRLLQRRIVDPEQIGLISCTAQWSGTVAVDRYGQPLMNAIIWMDSRGARYLNTVLGGWPRILGYNAQRLQRWLRLTGGAPGRAGKDPLAHILWIKHALPQIYQATHKFLEPKDYINLLLCGRFAATYDSIALHWVTDNRDHTRIDYDPQLLRFTGIERHRLPDLCRATDVLGPLTPGAADALGLSPQTLLIGGTPDLHSAAIGSGGVQDFAAHLYIGTSAWIGCHVPYKKTDLLHNMASLPAPLPGRYLLVNEQESAGACLTFLRDQLIYVDDVLASTPRPERAYARFDELAAQAAPGSGGLIFAPWLYGERTPVEEHALRGAFFNLSLSTSRAELLRAVLEGVAYNARWLLQAVEGFVQQPLPLLRMIGGGARSDLWCQIMADVLNRRIEQVALPIESNLRGAALLAALAFERITLNDIPAHVWVTRSYQPDPARHAVYDRLFQAFLEFYRRNRTLYAQLNSQ